jgi:hypothetical protein
LTILVWFAAVVLCFLALARSGASSKERRPYFWLKVTLLATSPVLFITALFGISLVVNLSDGVFTAIMSVMGIAWIPIFMVLIPGVLYKRPDPPPGESDGRGGGGPGPDPPPRPPSPRGGIPLLDADQALKRARDHFGPSFGGRKKARRPAREPERTPIRRIITPVTRGRWRTLPT